MRDRLGGTPENQADTHAGSEQHGQPGNFGKLGLGLTPANPQTRSWTEGEIDQKDQSQENDQQVKPTGMLNNLGQGSVAQSFELCRRQTSDDCQCYDQEK